MSNSRVYSVLAPLMGAWLLGSATAGIGGGSLEKEARFDGPTVLVTDLAADVPILTDRHRIVHAPQIVDPDLVNPWGMAENGTSPFWVSDNNQGVVTLYN